LTKRQRVLCSSSRLSQRSGLFTDAGFALWFGLRSSLCSLLHLLTSFATLWLPLHSFHL
jgi:hypothetical protein